MDVNTIYNEDCLITLSKMEDNFIDLIVTSPPYNKNFWTKDREKNWHGDFIRKIEYSAYDDNLPHEDYVEWQKKVIGECLRVLKPTGSLFYNHMDIMKNHLTIHPTWVYEFPLKQVIIWDKCGTPKWGDSYFLPFNEWIFWIKKEKDSKPYFDRNSALFKKNIWSIPRSQEPNHPAPFSDKVVENVILSCSKEDDLVYDPFMGSGTTAKMCVHTNRRYIGSEISKEYCDIAENRIHETVRHKPTNDLSEFW